jgi:hypothetical protein
MYNPGDSVFMVHPVVLQNDRKLYVKAEIHSVKENTSAETYFVNEFSGRGLFVAAKDQIFTDESRAKYAGKEQVHKLIKKVRLQAAAEILELEKLLK